MTAVPACTSFAPDEADAHLGPVILQQKATHAIGMVYLCGGVVLLMVGFCCLLIPAFVERTAELVIGGSCVVLGLAFLIAGVYQIWTWRDGVLFLHERGIRRRRTGQESVVRFDQVAEMKYQSTRVFVNGTYGGTVENLSVRTRNPDGQWLYFQRRREEVTGLATGYVEASEVDRVSRNISNLLLPRMSNRMMAGESVPWTSRMRLKRDGVELSRTRWYECELVDLFRRQPRWEFFSWDKIDRAQFNQGTLFVWVKGQKTPRLRVLTGEVNFHPGYTLFAAAIQQSDAAGQSKGRMSAREFDATNRAETLAFGFTWNAADHIARQWNWDRFTPEGRRDWLVRILVPIGTASVLCLLLAAAARLRNQVTTVQLLLLLGAIAVGACLSVALLHAGLRWSERRRIAKEIRAAHELAQRGLAVDPLDELKLVLGPTGYSWRGRAGVESQVLWQQVARIKSAAGYIFLHSAASKLERESIDMMIPPRAFANQSEVQATLERIKEWHAQAITRGV
jgi:membrane protein implicated in regulation of membrane protease activity